MSNIFHSMSLLMHSATTRYICYNVTEENGWNRAYVQQFFLLGEQFAEF